MCVGVCVPSRVLPPRCRFFCRSPRQRARAHTHTCTAMRDKVAVHVPCVSGAGNGLPPSSKETAPWRHSFRRRHARVEALGGVRSLCFWRALEKGPSRRGFSTVCMLSGSFRLRFWGCVCCLVQAGVLIGRSLLVLRPILSHLLLQAPRWCLSWSFRM